MTVAIDLTTLVIANGAATVRLSAAPDAAWLAAAQTLRLEWAGDIAEAWSDVAIDPSGVVLVHGLDDGGEDRLRAQLLALIEAINAHARRMRVT